MRCWILLPAALLAQGMGAPGADANEPGLTATEGVQMALVQQNGFRVVW